LVMTISGVAAILSACVVATMLGMGEVSRDVLQDNKFIHIFWGETLSHTISTLTYSHAHTQYLSEGRTAVVFSSP